MIPAAFLVQLLVLLVVVGLVLYLVRALPIEPWIKTVAYVIVVVILLLYLLSFLPVSAPLIR
jgi:hypothetical protein